MRRRICIIAISLMLIGCSIYPKIVDSWPEELPPASVFVAEYKADLENQASHSVENYLLWVKRFYKGWVVYDRGWLRMSTELTSEINDTLERQKAQEKMHQIGLLIALEWAKEKESRYIRTNAVVAWGESLLEAVSRGEWLNLMDSVAFDIGLLQQGELTSDEIKIERYFPELTEDGKDDFFF